MPVIQQPVKKKPAAPQVGVAGTVQVGTPVSTPAAKPIATLASTPPPPPKKKPLAVASTAAPKSNRR